MELSIHSWKVMKRCFFLPQLTFKRPSNDRNLTFEMIAKEAQLPLEEVSNELVLMNCFPCFCTVMITLVKVWENGKSCGNMRQR